MKQRKILQKILLIFSLLVTTQAAFASRMQTQPLEDRLRAAEVVFVGKVVNKVIDGDWVRAELLVERPLKNSKYEEKFKVVWRAKIGGRPIYDTAEGARAIAILKDKHEGRYWLRGDKFESLKTLEQVKAIIGVEKNQDGEQSGADQTATAPESKSEGGEKPKPVSEERPQ